MSEKMPPPPTAGSGALLDFLDRMPDTNITDALESLSLVDPVVWCAYYRRIKRRWPLVYDYSASLTPHALAALQKRSKTRYAQELKTLHLKHRPFLLAPMRDQHPHKCYEKARQVGISELSLSETLWFLYAHPGTKAMYTFPRDTQLKDFSNTRIAEAFQETPRMAGLLTGMNQVMSKKIGNGSHLILRSAWESNLGEGVDADIIILDEKDRMKPGVDIAFKESLASSRFGYIREVSTPTLPNRGIDKPFSKSDQMSWHVKCSKCGLEQEIEYPDNIQQVKEFPLGSDEIPEGSYEYLCRKTKCRGPLDRMFGRWVPRYPERKDIRGYHIPQTIAPWISATDIMRKKKEYVFDQLWTNYCLGRVSKGDNIFLSDEDFEAACAGHDFYNRRTEDWQNISVGIDWGHLNWVVIWAQNVHNERWYIIGIGIFEDSHTKELESVKAIDDFIAPFEPDVIIADAGYGKDRNSYLLRKYGAGRFFACGYNPSTKHSRTFTPVWSNVEGARVLVDRTMSIKNACRSIRELEVGLPSLEDNKTKLLKKHFMALAPLRTQEEGSSEIVEEISASGDDHLVHAFLYGQLGVQYLTRGSKFSYDFVG